MSMSLSTLPFQRRRQRFLQGLYQTTLRMDGPSELETRAPGAKSKNPAPYLLLSRLQVANAESKLFFATLSITGDLCQCHISTPSAL